MTIPSDEELIGYLLVMPTTPMQVAAADRLAALAKENERLREALEKYADEENWTRHCQYDLYREWVPEEEHGYDTAQEALKEKP